MSADQLAYSCFSHLMKRMSQNFPNGGAMDTHFANMRSLIQVSPFKSSLEDGAVAEARQEPDATMKGRNPNGSLSSAT